METNPAPSQRKPLPSVPAALSFLREHGYTASRSKVYADIHRGHLEQEPGGFPPDKLLTYGATHCRKLSSQSERDKLQAAKLRAEVKRLEAQARRQELAAKREAGELVPVARVAQELAARAQLLRSDFEQFAHTLAAEFHEWAERDPWEIAEMLRDRTDEFFHRYSEPRTFVATICADDQVVGIAADDE